jgi:hypothetical protein
MAFTNLNEPNLNAIIVHDGVLLEDGCHRLLGVPGKERRRRTNKPSFVCK